MIQPATNLFNNDPGSITDFSQYSSSDIFNSAIVPRMNSLLSEAGIDAMKQRQQEQDAQNAQAQDLFTSQNESLSLPQQNYTLPLMDGPDEDYNAPIYSEEAPPRAIPVPEESAVASPNAPSPVSQNQQDSSSFIKLANYGYSSDTSPDYNSNVLRIGHANNKLEDGLSAALTKSLATRLGLKTGDMFEAVAEDGTIYKRRYDDTVPTSYKGKPLPETVDLYELGGSNSFGGRIKTINPIR